MQAQHFKMEKSIVLCVLLALTNQARSEAKKELYLYVYKCKVEKKDNLYPFYQPHSASIQVRLVLTDTLKQIEQKTDKT